MSNKDSELKPLLERLLSLNEAQMARLDKLEDAVRENTVALNNQAVVLDRHSDVLDRHSDVLDRHSEMISSNATAIAALSKKVDEGFQKTAILIQSDRGEIAEVRGGLDVLGKRYDALISLKRD